MAHYNVFGESQNKSWIYDERLRGAGDPVQDSSPLFIYSPPGAWIDTPLEFNDSPSLVRHASISLWLNRLR
jgi:hypothetical protein